jgi:hypothetical protein
MPALNDVVIFVAGTLLTALFVHLAAAFTLGGTKYRQAILVAIIGNLLGFLVFALFGDPKGGRFALAFLLVLVSWLAVTTTVYRTSVWKAFFIGLFAFFLYGLVRLVVDSVVQFVHRF